MLNVVVIHGVVSRPAQLVELPSGGRLVHVEVTVRQTEGPAETVPVAWFDPPAWAGDLQVGTELVLTGRVRRRFFRVGGVTQSRTEVVAAKGSCFTSQREVASILRDTVGVLRGAAESLSAC